MQFAPQHHRGHFGGGGGLGGHNGWTDWHQIRYTSVESFGNGHRLKTIRPMAAFWRFLGGQQFKSLGNVVKLKFCTYNAGESGNGHRLNTFSP